MDRKSSASNKCRNACLGSTLLILVAACAPTPSASMDTLGEPAHEGDSSLWGEYASGGAQQDAETVTQNDDLAQVDVAAALNIVNHGPSIICDVYISQDANEGWGENRLEEYIEPYQGAVIQLESGSYDLLLRDCDGTILGSREQLEISRDVTWTLTDESAPRATLTIINQTGGDLCEVHISPLESAFWGGSWLPTILEQGETAEIHPPQGIYDLRAVSCEMDEMILQGVELSNEYEWAVIIEEDPDPDCGNAVCTDEEYFTMSCLRDCAGEIYATMMIVNEIGTSICAFEIDDNTSDKRYDAFEILDNAHASFPVPLGDWTIRFEDCSGKQVNLQYLQVTESFTLFVRQY